MCGVVLVHAAAEIAVEHVHEAGHLDLVVAMFRRLGEHANLAFTRLRREEAAGLILEIGADEITGLAGLDQPVAIAGGGIEIEKRLSDGERIAEERPAAILVAMAK